MFVQLAVITNSVDTRLFSVCCKQIQVDPEIALLINLVSAKPENLSAATTVQILGLVKLVGCIEIVFESEGFVSLDEVFANKHLFVVICQFPD